MFKKSLLAVATVLIVLLISPAFSNSIVFQDDFESRTLNGWAKEICCGKHSMTFVKTPNISNRQGNRSIKFALRKTDPDVHNSKRSELALKPVPQNSEYTYKFSMFLSKKYRIDPSFEILAQWHGFPDFDLGETWRSPPLALVTKNGEFELRRGWDSEVVTENKTINKESINLGEYSTAEWADWIFHIKWSHEYDGLIEVWKNGELILTKEGANTYNDEIGTYFKIGIYKPDWKYKPQDSKTQWRAVYYDDIKIINHNLYAD